jgi:hypothetical protein
MVSKNKVQERESKIKIREETDVLRELLTKCHNLYSSLDIKEAIRQADYETFCRSDEKCIK